MRPKDPLVGLQRVRHWLFDKQLGERSAGCVLCGSCYGHGPVNPMEDVPGPKTKCPPYEYYRFQRHTPKSRWLMAQRVFHGLEQITPELKEVVYSCTNCLMCQEICGVRNDGYGPWEINVAMREEITEKQGPIEAHRSLHAGLREHDNPWGLAVPQRAQWASGLNLKNLGEGSASTLLFAGCFASRPGGERGPRALAKLMQVAGEEFAILGTEEKCCGLYAFDLGFRREYERLREENLGIVKHSGIRRVIIACGSCRRIWEQYQKQSRDPFETFHGTEYVAALVASDRLKFTKTVKKRVTYHDSCHLGRGCGVYEPPRKILLSIPGIELVEMERNRRWSWCCGGGGGVPEADPALAASTATDRLQEAREAGAELVLTSSALCERSFSEVPQPLLPVQDLLDFACECL